MYRGPRNRRDYLLHTKGGRLIALNYRAGTDVQRLHHHVITSASHYLVRKASHVVYLTSVGDSLSDYRRPVKSLTGLSLGKPERHIPALVRLICLLVELRTRER